MRGSETNDPTGEVAFLCYDYDDFEALEFEFCLAVIVPDDIWDRSWIRDANENDETDGIALLAGENDL